MTTVKTFTFAADHPAAAGHFPGHPLAPAALILSKVLAAVRDEYGQLVREITATKFLAALTPGKLCNIHLIRTNSSEILEFQCRVDDQVIAAGLLTLSPDADLSS